MMKSIHGLAIAVVLATAPLAAHAAPIVVLDASNVGIGSISVDVTGTTITVNEDWTSNGLGALLISGLDAGVDYTVVKNITNHTGSTWTRFANELLDPAGQSNDTSDPQPQPAFVPTGYTTSNDFDGLSFAQGGSIPRTSVAFASLLVDEATNARDFLDFFNGNVANDGVDTFSFGLRDNGNNQPFLLVQRPNESSVETPEPVSAALLGMGLLGLGFARRRRA